eukprot:7348536-Alexandrium_andersonii.AAC.1
MHFKILLSRGGRRGVVAPRTTNDRPGQPINPADNRPALPSDARPGKSYHEQDFMSVEISPMTRQIAEALDYRERQHLDR